MPLCPKTKNDHVFVATNKHIQMEVSECFFEILFNIIKQQNISFLREIAMNEGISYTKLLKDFKLTRKHLREFIRHHHLHRESQTVDA
jgi:hypothetical protein